MKRASVNIGLYWALLTLVGCASGGIPTNPSQTSSSSLADTPTAAVPVTEPGGDPATAIENITIGDVIRLEEPNTQTLYDNSRYDFPIMVNSRVEKWLDYFTGRGRRHMHRYLSRSARYVPLMSKILREEGVPEDLIFLALIESGFNLRARSHAAAVGPWQFIRGTGKRYGLRIDQWIDERRDPVRSTVAAARYLKDLYLMFESWYLAASAYNAGEYKILRAIETLKTNNFWAIAKTRHIRRETKDYVPKLIAAAIIGKNPERYGFGDVKYLEPIAFDEVEVDFAVHLQDVGKLLDAEVEDLADLNPELRRKIVPPDSVPYSLRVPPRKGVLVSRAMSSLRHSFAKLDKPVQHRVRRGESLYSVSRKYGVNRHTLASTNNISPRSRLRLGQLLIVPTVFAGTPPDDSAKRRTAKFRTPAKSKYVKRQAGDTHRVRRGESLWSIADRYDVTVGDLFRWNSLGRSKIYPGMRLKVNAPKVAASRNGYVVHVVRNGDSLWSISQAYDVSIREIKRWNRLSHSRIIPGKRLRIKKDQS